MKARRSLLVLGAVGLFFCQVLVGARRRECLICWFALGASHRVEARRAQTSAGRRKVESCRGKERKEHNGTFGAEALKALRSRLLAVHV